MKLKPISNQDDLNMTAPTVIRQAQSSIFNQTTNITEISRRQSEIVGDYTCRLHLALNQTQNLAGGHGTQLKFSNLSSHLKTPLYKEIVKKVDDEDMSDRMKLRKPSQFMNEVTYKYVLKAKKRGVNESTIESEEGVTTSRKKLNQSPGNQSQKKQDGLNTSQM
jgi:hypothetical protein